MSDRDQISERRAKKQRKRSKKVGMLIGKLWSIPGNTILNSTERKKPVAAAMIFAVIGVAWIVGSIFVIFFNISSGFGLPALVVALLFVGGSLLTSRM